MKQDDLIQESRTRVRTAHWHHPLPIGSVADRYLSGPTPDGDQEALVELDPTITPWAPPFLLKQLPVTIAGSVTGAMQVLPYPRMMGWFSTNLDHEMDLGGTVTVYLGAQLEQHSFDAPTLVYIPANTPHGVVVYGSGIRRPINFVDTYPEGQTGEPRLLPELDERLPDFRLGLPDKSGNPPPTPEQIALEASALAGPRSLAGGDAAGPPPVLDNLPPGMAELLFHDPRYPWNPAGGGEYGQYFFSGRKPDPVTPLPATQLRILPGDIPGLPLEKSSVFIYTSEDLALNDVPLHIPHAHPCTETLVFFSMDPDDPHRIGADIKLYAFDTTIKKLVPVTMSKPFASCSARGKHLHCPVVHRNMERRTGFLWYTTDYDPTVFAKGPKMGLSMQLHNGHYTNGLFNLTEYGVAPEDVPFDAEGDGGWMTEIEPHTAWPVTKGHDGVNAPRLTKRLASKT